MADGSHIMLNPEADAVLTAASLTSYSDDCYVRWQIIQEGDQIIVVAEDDDSYRLGASDTLEF